MPSHFVNQTREAGQFRSKAQVVHRNQTCDQQEALDHPAAPIGPRQIEWMCVRQKPLEGGSTLERLNGWAVRIERAVARNEFHPAQRHRLSWCHLLGLAGTLRQRVHDRAIDAGRKRESDRAHDRLLDPEHKRIVGPVPRAMSTDRSASVDFPVPETPQNAETPSACATALPCNAS